MKRLTCLILFILLLTIGACQSADPASPAANPSLASEASPPIENPPSTETITAIEPTLTPTPAPLQQEIPPEPIMLQTSDGAPLRLAFPPPAPHPGSAWRPPLYEVPWALTPYDHFYFNRPIAADEVNWPLADYRYGGIFFGTDIVHTGIDIDAPEGTPVVAAAAGKVIWVGYGLFYFKERITDPYGLAVAIRHDFGYQGERLYTVYAHLSRTDVQLEQIVQSGEQIGLVGNTGNTTGPHLHFEIRLGRNDFFATRNPELWLAPPQGWGVLAGRVMDDDKNLMSNQKITVNSNQTSQSWYVYTYGPHAVRPDDYYNENMVLSDLPAGKYTLWIEYKLARYEQVIEIFPGRITYFTFQGEKLYTTKPPPTPVPQFLSTPTP